MTCLNSDTSPLLFARSCLKYQLVSTCHGLWKCFRGWEKKLKSMRSHCHSNRRYGNGAMAFAFVRMTGQVTAPAPFYCTCRAGPGLVTRLFSLLGPASLCLCSFNSMSATVEHAEPNRYCDGLCQNFFRVLDLSNCMNVAKIKCHHEAVGQYRCFNIFRQRTILYHGFFVLKWDIKARMYNRQECRPQDGLCSHERRHV